MKKMNERELDKLKEVLAVPTYFGKDWRMRDFILQKCKENGWRCETQVVKGIGDNLHHNIYVTKNSAERYPCFVSHIDTVHKVNENLKVEEAIVDGELRVYGVDGKDGSLLGVGGDDKCGVYMCLRMLEELDAVKVAFFGGEEIGMIGSRALDIDFFKDCKWAIQFDSPGHYTISRTLMDVVLCDTDSNLWKTALPMLAHNGVTDLADHPYTDVYNVRLKTGLQCMNIPAGYYEYHRKSEYVLPSVVERFVNVAKDIALKTK